MLTAIPYKTKQFLLVLIKIGLVVAAFYFIYTKLFNNTDLHFNEFVQYLMNFSSISTITALILVLLSISNWFFEILKWQTLVSRITNISVNEAASQTLGALTASLMTPNRIGDYGAKAMYYPSQHRKKIMLLNLVGNCGQMTMTLFFGIIGFGYLTWRYQSLLNYNNMILGVGVIAIVFLMMFGLMKTTRFIKQRNAVCKLITFLKSITRTTLLKTVLFSAVRYLIFSFQFYYLLDLFGIEINYFEAMAVISSMYLLSSLIPSIFILDVIVKGGVAIYMFGIIGVPEAIILSIITLMWILNFVLPSVIGSYHVLNFKLSKTVS